MTYVPARILIVMGVSSSGKSVTGKAIARRLHAPFLDGDDFHPPANKEKMRAGTPLVDADRWPWLKSLAEALHGAADHKGVAVGACSALKRAYRDYLRAQAGEPILFSHGTPTWSFEWRHLISALSPEFRTIAPDHLGFGLSDRPHSAPAWHRRTRKAPGRPCGRGHA